MKSVSTSVSNTLQQSLAVQSSVQVIAEWNMNRYSAIASITNNGVADYNPDIFPIESIAQPKRPKKGILKARVAELARASAIGAEGYVSGSYKDNVLGPRYVTASKDAKYKYWTSPAQSAGSSYVNTPSAISNVNPQILYTNLVWTNKIVIGVEDSYAAPSAWTIQITTDGTNWTTVATNPVLDASGRVTIYRQADNSWATTTYRENPMQIKGIKVNVTQMNKSKVFFNLIEVSPRLESDLSTFVKNWSVNSQLSDHSFVTPLGKASTNEGSVTLSNIDARFTNDNPSSLYYGLLDKGVKFDISLGISTDPYASPTKTYEWIKMGTLFSEDWGDQSREKTDVKLYDDSEHLKNIKPSPLYYENKTAAEIIWRVLDSIGYNNYNYEKIDSDVANLVPYFWTDGEKTVWDIINELCQPMQMAVYFDEYGVLQIKTRNTAYNLTKTVSWQFDAVTNGLKLADVVEANKTYDYEANVVNVAYRDTKVSDFNNGQPALESVWQPEDTTVLRATALFANITATSPSFKIDPADAKYWPYTGVVQMEGELMRYTAKGYTYYKGDGTMTSKYIRSEDERKELDRLQPSVAFKNYFNGYLWCGTTNRGIWNTVPKAHTVDASGYTKKYRTGSGAIKTWEGGWILQRGSSTVKMQTNNTFKGNTWYVASRGNQSDPRPYYWGTRFKFNAGYNGGVAGIAMCLGTNDSGYYLELFRTSLMTPGNRATQNEICFYVRDVNGNMKRYGPNNNKGAVFNVVPENWYDIDVSVATQASARIFSIFINGIFCFNVTVPSSGYPASGDTGRFGIFTRSYTSATFEYLYASTSAEVTQADEATVFDRITGGYQSLQAVDEFGYRVRDVGNFTSPRPNPAVADKYGKFFMDEFGAVAHEVREFDVKFSKVPVQHSRLYWSNETQVLCPEYNADPFGAKFILANRYRQNAVVSGEDTLTFGADNAVNQQAMIYGRVVNQADAQVVTVKDDIGVRRRGEVAVDIESDWIQTKAFAQDIADWIKLHWSTGADEVKVESFGNPLLQLGDVVSINHPLMNMSPSTHKYFVVEADHSYETGLKSTFVLRRAKI